MPDESNPEIQQTINDLKSLRDEIKGRIQGAGNDVKDTWRKLEPRLQELEQRASRAADRTVTEVREAAKDLKTRFKKLRDEL